MSGILFMHLHIISSRPLADTDVSDFAGGARVQASAGGFLIWFQFIAAGATRKTGTG